MTDKTILELAQELGVSKDKVKYRIKKLPRELLYKKQGITYIKKQGLSIIIEDFLGNKNQKKDREIPMEITHLKKHIESLEKQLLIKDKQLFQQATTKDKQIDNLQKLLDQQQQLMQAEQKKNQLFLEEAKQTVDAEKNGFFNRLFSGSKK
ncbi:DNA-binding protein [Listeria sp. ILCC792]|uniref:DNA-binding protein n=1 Tax=Listeria sp. ILCC792 TaxID=1918331 RepID=UPI000B58A069|nr:DNA-binding protein [Listeria sp. ILCC792]